MEHRIMRYGLLLASFGLLCNGPAQAQKSTEDLARAAQNPIASMISLPLQNNTNLHFGPQEETQNVLNVQPVYPVSLNDEINVVARTIMPVVSQPAFAPGQERENGIGNTTIVPYLTPSKPGMLLWGAAPVVMLPASNQTLGSRAWGLGASAVFLAMPGKWVVGSTFTNVWSVDADPADKVNLFTWQYFINYNLPKGWYLTSSPILTANWEAASGDKWTVPFGGGAGRVYRLGKQALNTSLQAYYNVERPAFGPDWQVRLQLTFLFPK